MEGIEGMNTLAEFLAQPGYGQIFNQPASRPNDAAEHIADARPMPEMQPSGLGGELPEASAY